MDKNKSKKVFKCIIAFLVIILLFKAYSIYSGIKAIQAIGSMSLQYVMDHHEKTDPNTFPEFAKKFRVNDNLKNDLFQFYAHCRSSSTVYNKEDKEKYNDAFQKLKSKTNYNIDSFKNELVPTIISFMDQNKSFSYPTYEESKNLASPPDSDSIENTSEYWIFISRLFEEKNDYYSSLVLLHGIFYLLKDYQTKFKNNLKPISEYYIVEIAFKGIIEWASKPKPQHIALSQKIANDILDLVNSEYAFSKIIEYRKSNFIEIVDYCINRELHYSSFLKGLKESKKFNDLLNSMYDEPLKFADKPLYEINDYLQKFTVKEKENYKFIKIAVKGYFGPLNLNFLLFPQRTQDEYIYYKHSLHFDLMKKAYEQKLAEMEMAAIALVINAYYCEKGALPNNMEELSKWFGRDLPNDRLTNKAYDLKDKFDTLHNSGVFPMCPLNYLYEDEKKEKKQKNDDDDLLDINMNDLKRSFYFNFNK